MGRGEAVRRSWWRGDQGSRRCCSCPDTACLLGPKGGERGLSRCEIRPPCRAGGIGGGYQGLARRASLRPWLGACARWAGSTGQPRAADQWHAGNDRSPAGRGALASPERLTSGTPRHTEGCGVLIRSNGPAQSRRTSGTGRWMSREPSPVPRAPKFIPDSPRACCAAPGATNHRPLRGLSEWSESATGWCAQKQWSGAEPSDHRHSFGSRDGCRGIDFRRNRTSMARYFTPSWSSMKA